jgi:tetratricopeptide (TPR) repeat protein
MPSAQAQVNLDRRTLGRSQLGRSLYIEGQVVSQADNSPLQGVRLRLTERSGATIATSFTDKEGKFVFLHLNRGNYFITAVQPSYREKTQQVGIFDVPTQDVRIVLLKETGEQRTDHGLPVPAWALKIPGRAQREYKKGLKELQEGKHKKSIAYLQAAIRLYPQYASAYSALATVHLKLGDQEAAMAVFERALEIDEKLPDACFGLGVLYNAQKRFGDAVRYLLRARMLRLQDWHAHYELGQAYGGVADWPKAEASLRRARELHSDFPRTHLLLINALALQNKYDATLAAMENYLRLFPQDSFTPQVRQKRDLLQAELEKKPLPPEPEKP